MLLHEMQFMLCEVVKNGTRIEAHIAECKKTYDTIKNKYMIEAELRAGLTSGQLQELDGTFVYLKMKKVKRHFSEMRSESATAYD